MSGIVEALSKVMAYVGAVKKGDRNEAQRFNFRGIDAVVNAVSPALRMHGVVVTPELVSIDRDTVEVGQKRTPMGHVTVVVKYTFTATDGSSLSATVAGEAMDSGDKATPKAMSVAFRTALLQALCLPTDEPDPDSHTYERSDAALSDDEFAAVQNRMRAANDLATLDRVAREIGQMPLSSGQRETLRGLYLGVKTALTEIHQAAVEQMSADAEAAAEAMIP